jgi:hypothetical protein
MSYNPIRWIAAFIHWMHLALCALMNPEGRRAWAVILCGGCGIIESAYSTYALLLLRDHPGYVFWLGTEANGLVLIVVSCFTGLLVKRNIGGQWNVGSSGGKIDIDQTGDGQ